MAGQQPGGFFAVGVRVDGLRPLVARLNRIDRTLTREGLKRAHKRVGDTVVAASHGGAPRRSGRLDRTARAAAQQRRSVVRAGTARVPYAGPIHWGWPDRFINAQPWLAEAAQASEATWVTQYNQDLLALVENTPEGP